MVELLESFKTINFMKNNLIFFLFIFSISSFAQIQQFRLTGKILNDESIDIFPTNFNAKDKFLKELIW